MKLPVIRKRNKNRNPSKTIKKIGLVPGTLTYTGIKDDSEFCVEVIDYTKNSFERHVLREVDNSYEVGEENSVTWTNINGLHNVKDIQRLGEFYGLHPLILEDIVDTHQRPKIDEYEDYLFVIAKMLYYKDDELVIEHISMVLGENYVLTFQESDGDVFDALRKRIEDGKGRVRGEKSDYLLFCILDAIIDHYFLVTETLGEKIEDLEDILFNDPDETSSRQIQDLKKEALRIRRSVFPVREVVNRLEKSESKLILPQTVNYYRDLYDNTIQVIETVEIYRDMIWGLIDMYMSTISNKMNNVMKVLTIIATIFIPLTFIVGVYGMNFDYMPELHYKEAYYIVWLVMIVVFVGMAYYFRRKKWL